MSGTKPPQEKATEPKPFCIWHIATKENPAGTDCSAHIHEARVGECVYASPEDRAKSAYPCVDYKPLGKMEIRLADDG